MSNVDSNDSARAASDDLLVDPRTKAALRRETDAYVGSDGQRFRIEDGIVRMLVEVDPELAVELEAQRNGVDEYMNPAYLMPRYERDMAQLAVEELFAAGVPRGRILDAGCGIGLLGRLYPSLSLVGLDASVDLLREARVGYSLRVEASAETLPFPDGCFDAVVALNMLHHVINPARAVSEFARVLRSGGSLVAVDPRKVWPIELAKKVLRGNNASFAPTHKAFTTGEYVELLSAGGSFQLEVERRVGLTALLVMGGLDALKVSPLIAGDGLAQALRRVDATLFRVKPLQRAGLNLVVRARRTATAARTPTL